MRPDNEALAAWRALLEVHQRLTADMDATLRAEHNLPLAWYDVLVQLIEADRPLRMHELADRALFSRTECTRVVARMEAAGLVAKEPDPHDGRGVYAAITAEGRVALRRAARTHLADIERSFAAHLSDEEATIIAAALARVVAASD
ncbi:MAG: MarR family transcriptional regulator [Acidimicrobiia bacterium]